MRVLVVSHGHPAVTRGGAETAAYTLFRALCDVPGTQAFFLGAQRGRPEPCLGEPITQPFADAREYLYVGGAFDWFRLANHDPDFPRAFTALLHALRPDVLHMHHVLEFGVEAILLARRALPGLRIVLTLHEYLLICHHHGQMIKRPSRALCHRATPQDCHACFPDRAPSDFFLRTLYLRRFLDLVDEFVAPSRFLAARMVAWGLPAERVRFLPNLVAAGTPAPPRPPDGRLVVGYFGQISALKGVGVLLDAAALLHAEGRRDIAFEVHGTMAGQPPDLLDDLPSRLAAPPPNVRVAGAYLPEQVDGLMAGVDVVCVPSIWWENAPTVIAEAHRVGRRVVCSDIGGMAEAAAAGDVAFRAGLPAAFASALAGLVDHRGKLGQASSSR
jgi:glycosyltransferase involved in cell wall biosynthesis